MIFLHRQYSLQPFARHYRHADTLLLDMFMEGDKDRELQLRPEYKEQLLKDLSEYHKVLNGCLLA